MNCPIHGPCLWVQRTPGPKGPWFQKLSGPKGPWEPRAHLAGAKACGHVWCCREIQELVLIAGSVTTPCIEDTRHIRGAVKIDLEDVLRVRRVYIAMHLNGDIASGRPGATSYRADFRLKRSDLRSWCSASVAEDPNNYLQPALSGFDVVTSTVICVNCSEVL